MNFKIDTALVVGTMRLGTWGANYSTDELEKFIDACLDLGLNEFDHADIYGHYTTESAFGEVLSKRKDLKNKLNITTKCGIALTAENKPNHIIKHYNFSKDHIIQSAEASLKNLGVEQIKLFLLHRPDLLMQGEEVAKAFEQLKSQGKVEFFGVSNFTKTQFEYLNSFTNLVNNQVEISLANPKALLNDLVLFLQHKKVKVTAWSPLGGGVFFGENSIVKKFEKEFNSLCEKYNCTLDQLLYAWLYKHPAKIVPITGSSKIERIKAALEAKAIILERQDWYKMLEMSRGEEVA